MDYMDNPLADMDQPLACGHRLEKRDGFPGQRIIVLPRRIVSQATQHPLMRALVPTDVGYFPSARQHLRARPDGVDQVILIYCVKGGGWCEIGNRMHKVAQGQLLAVPPGTPHIYGADESHPWTIRWLHAIGEHVRRMLEELGASPANPVVRIGDAPQVHFLFEELLTQLEHGYSPSRLLYASQMLTYLFGAVIWHHRLSSQGVPGPAQRVLQTIHYMKQHLAEPLRVQQLAGLANLSPAHYSTRFKMQTGYSPMHYFIRLRMHAACQLLDTTELSVKEIADLAGYQDPLYFSRLFHSINDQSPSEYRKRMKG
ncbi:MAG TPA: AraC family transcriptional regulator [Tepidisphaeraceae bacterium]|nr:AraC family transcriptional regulator [Tepidisphaeraceae bacterium]